MFVVEHDKYFRLWMNSACALRTLSGPINTTAQFFRLEMIQP